MAPANRAGHRQRLLNKSIFVLLLLLLFLLFLNLKTLSRDL